MESKRLDNAALAAGISPNYINAHGKPQSISAETKRRLLDAMHQRTATKVAVTPVPNVMVYTSGKKMPMVVEGVAQHPVARLVIRMIRLHNTAHRTADHYATNINRR